MTPVLLLILACAADPDPGPAPPIYDLNDPPRPERPATVPVVRSVADLIAHDRQWVEVQGVLGPVERTGPPKGHWKVSIEVGGGFWLTPEVVGDVTPWQALERQAIRVTGLLSVCSTWAVSQRGGRGFLSDQEAPVALRQELPLTSDAAERAANQQAVETYCEQRRAALIGRGG